MQVPLVLTQPDRPAGRGRRVTQSAVKVFSEANDLIVQQPLRLDDESCLAHWGARPELLVVVAYGLLLPEWLLAWPLCGAVNIHASLLPRWRGAAPIQRAILEGDLQTGISIMRMERGLDAGPVFRQGKIDIDSSDTAGSLHDRLAPLGAELLSDSLEGILDGSLLPVPQDESLVTYARKVSKAEAGLDWQQPAASLARRVRAFNPWPICTARLVDGRLFRVHEASVVQTSSKDFPGTIVSAGKEGIDVVTGDGHLRLLRIQPPAGKIMLASAYLNAHSLAGQSFVC
jgi:methionyl-tRNA formyltransferase